MVEDETVFQGTGFFVRTMGDGRGPYSNKRANSADAAVIVAFDELEEDAGLTADTAE